jgi:hypothetical protein
MDSNLAQIKPLRGVQSQQAPPGPFSLKDIVLQEALHFGKTFSCAALECNASSPGVLWRSFKEADSLVGKCGLVHSTKKRPVSGSRRGCILDVTVSCSNGVESQQQNKKRAQDAVDIMSGCHGRMVRHIHAASLRMKLTKPWRC